MRTEIGYDIALILWYTVFNIVAGGTSMDLIAVCELLNFHIKNIFIAGQKTEWLLKNDNAVHNHYFMNL